MQSVDSMGMGPLGPGATHRLHTSADALAGTVKARIVSEVKSACYYGVIMDSTIDVSHTDQLS